MAGIAQKGLPFHPKGLVTLVCTRVAVPLKKDLGPHSLGAWVAASS